jgi:hypothetical protein
MSGGSRSLNKQRKGIMKTKILRAAMLLGAVLLFGGSRCASPADQALEYRIVPKYWFLWPDSGEDQLDEINALAKEGWKVESSTTQFERDTLHVIFLLSRAKKPDRPLEYKIIIPTSNHVKEPFPDAKLNASAKEGWKVVTWTISHERSFFRSSFVLSRPKK